LRLDIDDEDLVIIAHKQRATAVGGKNSPDLHWHNIVLHASTLNASVQKNKSADAVTGD
jgi:hypothetical protein